MTATSHGTETYPFGPAERLEPHPRYGELRGRPLARVAMPHGGEAWLATRYEDVKTVLADPRFSRAEILGRDVPRITPAIQHESSILTMDPPDHSRLRKLVAKAFTARSVEGLRAGAQAVVDERIDAMVAEGAPADLAEFLAWPLPITVICQLLGVRVDDRDRFRAWTDQIMALTSTDPASIDTAREHLKDYLAELVAERRARPTDDLLGRLVAARDDDRLTERELVMFGVTLLVAGHETTANQIGNFVYQLLSRRELWDELVADPDRVPRAVEELLRFSPLGAAANFPRIATETLELGGRTVRAGEAVLVQMASANRDEAVFDRPNEIDFARADNPHVAFGHGVHHCLGAPLARMELRQAIGTLVRRLPALRLAVPADEVPWRANRLVRGVRALPVAW